MTRFVTVTPKVTADRFGCDQRYFDKHIKGKPLRVTSALVNLITVTDEEGEHWTIMKGDFVEQNKKEVQHA